MTHATKHLHAARSCCKLRGDETYTGKQVSDPVRLHQKSGWSCGEFLSRARESRHTLCRGRYNAQVTWGRSQNKSGQCPKPIPRSLGRRRFVADTISTDLSPLFSVCNSKPRTSDSSPREDGLSKDLAHFSLGLPVFSSTSETRLRRARGSLRCNSLCFVRQPAPGSPLLARAMGDEGLLPQG